MTKWSDFLKQKSKETGISYKCLLSNKEIQAEYRAKNPKQIKKKEPKLNQPKVYNKEFAKKNEDKMRRAAERGALQFYKTELKNLRFLDGNQNNFRRDNVEIINPDLVN